MNQLISPTWINRLIIFLTMAAVVKSLMLAASYFLPHEGVETIPFQEESYYTKYRPSNIFVLKKNKQKTAVKKKPVYKLDKLLLKGIYADKLAPFIAVEEKKKVTLISQNETFKGYKLIKVLPNKAIFSKSGRQYELTFKESKNNNNISYSKAPPVSYTAPAQLEEKAVFIQRKEIKHYAKNYDQIWKNIKIKEIIKDKRLKGFKVTWIKKGSIFAKMGLMKEDIITGVNGKPFKSLSQVFKLYNNMDNLDSLVLQIKRDNQERELEYEIYQ
ncbi:MAG: hypothetical protein DRG24_05275 [Epsilonproteobacteria bacterium]|nr:MAG: hypothetical protein DRG24_05275 [Campylobacterota bacterium]